jgi:shikimate kinase
MHALEAETLLAALAEREPTVVAAAASTVESAACRARLAELDVAVVWLHASPAFLARRFASSPHRPAFGPDVEAFLRDQARRREHLFESLRSIVVDVEDRPPDDLVAVIITSLRSRAARGSCAGGRPRRMPRSR